MITLVRCEKSSNMSLIICLHFIGLADNLFFLDFSYLFNLKLIILLFPINLIHKIALKFLFLLIIPLLNLLNLLIDIYNRVLFLFIEGLTHLILAFIFSKGRLVLILKWLNEPFSLLLMFHAYAVDR